MICDMWHVMCDIWYMVCDIWCAMCDMLYVICDMWLMVYYVMIYEVWCVAYDARCVIDGIWFLIYDMWYVKCELFVCVRMSFSAQTLHRFSAAAPARPQWRFLLGPPWKQILKASQPALLHSMLTLKWRLPAPFHNVLAPKSWLSSTSALLA